MDEKLKRSLLELTFFAAALFAAALHLDRIAALLKSAARAAEPIVNGLLFALALDRGVSFFETNLFRALKNPRGRRRAAVAFTCALTALAASTLPVFLAPALIQNITLFMQHMPGYVEKTGAFVRELCGKFGLEASALPSLQPGQFAETAGAAVQTALSSLYGLTAGLLRLVIAFAMSVYILLEKQRLLELFEQGRALLPAGFARETIGGGLLLFARIFRRFIGGQCTEAAILGGLCFAGMTVIGLPYAPLVSLLIAATSIVPVIGAYLGAAPALLLLLLENPAQALIFLLFLAALQQFEGSVIYPKVVGEAVGLSGLFVFAAVVVGTGVGGVKAAILSVPVAAAVCRMVEKALKNKKSALSKK